MSTVIGLDALAEAIADRHRQGCGTRWNGVRALLAAATELTSHSSIPELRVLLESIASTGLADVDEVPLYCAIPDATVAGRPFPFELRPGHPTGPAEEDVLRCALAAAADGPVWPHGPVAPERMVEAIQELSGRIRCRTRVLAVVAARYLMRTAPRQGPQRDWCIRRVIWLLDPRLDSAAELTCRLAGPDDPLIKLGPPLPSHTHARPEAPLPLADWDRWPAQAVSLTLSGRVSALRRHRRYTFFDIAWDGRSAQLALPTANAAQLRRGDIVVMTGTADRSRHGQPTLFGHQLDRHEPRLAWSGWEPDQDETANLLSVSRSFWADLRFRETLTPVLTNTFFGGAARPFTTWAHAPNQRSYLRVTTELALLERIASGTSRCYEIGPSFRNEGLRGQQHKEFLMLEAYAADLDLPGMVRIVAKYISTALGETRSLQWISFDDAFTHISGIHPTDSINIRQLAAHHTAATAQRTQDIDQLARRLWRGHLRSRLPGFIALHTIPGPASPLIAGQGRNADRIWIYLDGVELAEVSRNERDPHRLQERLSEQLHTESHPVHRDYSRALNVLAAGLPPSVGVGLGFTRLAQLRAARLGDHVPYPRQGDDQ
ncbi:amino acid--tRNA ligase-related protein [Nocardiopsis dassonvillei]